MKELFELGLDQVDLGLVVHMSTAAKRSRVCSFKSIDRLCTALLGAVLGDLSLKDCPFKAWHVEEEHEQLS